MPQLALIKTDDHWLALPHHCIATIEASSDIKTKWLQQKPWGVIQHRRSYWPVVGLDKQLQPVTAEQSTRLVVCFKQPTIALRCHQATSIELADIKPLPAMMRKSDQLVEGFEVYEDQLVLLLNADILLQRLVRVVPSEPMEEGVCSAVPGF